MEVDSVVSGKDFSSNENLADPSIINPSTNGETHLELHQKISLFQSNLGKCAVNVPDALIENCLDYINNHSIENAIYESLRQFRDFIPCPENHCQEILKKSRGAEGKYLSSLTVTCPTHGKFLAVKAIFSLPEKILCEIFEKSEHGEMMAIIEKFNAIDENLFQNLKTLLDDPKTTMGPKQSKQTAITDFLSTDKQENLKEESEQQQHRSDSVKNYPELLNNLMQSAKSLKPDDPMLLILITMLQTVTEMMNDFKDEIKNLRDELKIAKKDLKKPQNQTSLSAPYLQAAKKGAALSTDLLSKHAQKIVVDLKSPLNEKEIGIALRKSATRNFTFEQLKTVQVRCFSRCQIGIIKKIFLSAGINLLKIKDISFIGNQIMEVILFENYEPEFMAALKNLEERQEFKGLKVEKINFNPLEAANFKNERTINEDPTEKFQSRMKSKLARLKAREEHNPSLKRTVRYVESQIRCNSYEILTNHPLNEVNRLDSTEKITITQPKVNTEPEQQSEQSNIEQDTDTVNDSMEC